MWRVIAGHFLSNGALLTRVPSSLLLLSQVRRFSMGRRGWSAVSTPAGWYEVIRGPRPPSVQWLKGQGKGKGKIPEVPQVPVVRGGRWLRASIRDGPFVASRTKCGWALPPRSPGYSQLWQFLGRTTQSNEARWRLHSRKRKRKP